MSALYLRGICPARSRVADVVTEGDRMERLRGGSGVIAGGGLPRTGTAQDVRREQNYSIFCDSEDS